MLLSSNLLAQCILDFSNLSLNSSKSDEFNGWSMDRSKWSLGANHPWIDINSHPCYGPTDRIWTDDSPFVEQKYNSTYGLNGLHLIGYDLGTTHTFQNASNNKCSAYPDATREYHLKSGYTVSSFNITPGSVVVIRAKLPNHEEYIADAALWFGDGGSEIDLLESANSWPNGFSSNIHGKSPGGTWRSCPKIIEGIGNNCTSLAEKFHTYTLVWTDNYISMYFDYREVWTTNTPTGWWPSSPHAPTSLPICLQYTVQDHADAPQSAAESDPLIIDYVRTYDIINPSLPVKLEPLQSIPSSISSYTDVLDQEHAIAAGEDNIFLISYENWVVNLYKNSSGGWYSHILADGSWSSSERAEGSILVDNVKEEGGHQVYFRGKNDGRIHRYYWSNGWNHEVIGLSWPISMRVSSAPYSMALAQGICKTIYYRNVNNEVCIAYYDGSSWQYRVIFDGDGYLYQANGTKGNYQGPNRENIPSVTASLTSGSAVRANRSPDQYIFYRSHNGHLICLYSSYQLSPPYATGYSSPGYNWWEVHDISQQVANSQYSGVVGNDLKVWANAGSITVGHDGRVFIRNNSNKITTFKENTIGSLVWEDEALSGNYTVSGNMTSNGDNVFFVRSSTEVGAQIWGSTGYTYFEFTLPGPTSGSIKSLTASRVNGNALFYRNNLSSSSSRHEPAVLFWRGCENQIDCPYPTNTDQYVGYPLRNEEVAISVLELIPNPASDILTVEIVSEVPLPVDAHGVVLDAIGRTALTFSMWQKKQKVDISTLSPGVYWVRVETPFGPQMKKLFIQ